MSRKAFRTGAQGIANNLGNTKNNDINNKSVDKINSILEKRKFPSSSPTSIFSASPISSPSSPPSSSSSSSPSSGFSLWNWFYKSKPEVSQQQTVDSKLQPPQTKKKINLKNEREKEQVEFYSWGEGAGAQLGLGDDKSKSIPTKISSLSGKGLFSLSSSSSSSLSSSLSLSSGSMSCGLMHAGVITEKGETYTWGQNMFMQVGHDHSGGGLMAFVNEREPFPSSLRSLLPTDLSFISLSCGAWHSLAVGESGCGGNGGEIVRKVFVWGNGFHAQLGVETEQSFKQKKMLGSNYQFPTELKVLSRPLSHPSHIIMVSAGATHSVALTKDGKVFTWGGKRVPSPIEIDVSRKIIKKVTCGALHTLVLTEDGEVYSWGSGKIQDNPVHEGLDPYFFPGSASIIPSSANEIVKIEISDVVDIAAGNDMSAALTKSGEMYVWSANEKPEIVPELKDKKIVDIAVSWTHMAAVTEHGGLYMWRYSGVGDKTSESTKQSWKMKKDQETEDKFKHIAMHLTHDPCGNAVRPTRVSSGPLGDCIVLSVRLGWHFALAATLPRNTSSLIWRMKSNSSDNAPKKSNVLGGGRLKRGMLQNANKVG